MDESANNKNRATRRWRQRLFTPEPGQMGRTKSGGTGGDATALLLKPAVQLAVPELDMRGTSARADVRRAAGEQLPDQRLHLRRRRRVPQPHRPARGHAGELPARRVE